MKLILSISSILLHKIQHLKISDKILTRQSFGFVPLLYISAILWSFHAWINNLSLQTTNSWYKANMIRLVDGIRGLIIYAGAMNQFPLCEFLMRNNNFMHAEIYSRLLLSKELAMIVKTNLLKIIQPPLQFWSYICIMCLQYFLPQSF